MTTSALPSVLIVEDEQSIRDILVELFDVPESVVDSAATLGEAKSILAKRSFNLILSPHYDWGHRDHLHMEVRSGIKWFLIH